jgi:hypothetical protein
MRKMDTPVRDVLADREMELGPGGKPEKGLTHWSLFIDDEKIAWLILDRKGESANTISAEVLEELDKMLAAVDGKGPRGLVVRSAKPGGFIAGADVDESHGGLADAHRRRGLVVAVVVRAVIVGVVAVRVVAVRVAVAGVAGVDCGHHELLERVAGGEELLGLRRGLRLGLGVAHGSLERFIVNPFVRLANRRTGPVSQSVTFAEIDVQLNVTGGKTWNRLAPFLGAGAGIAFASGTPADTSQYEFGNKFYLVPHAGVRVFLSDRLHLRAEARATFWKLNYPTTFQQEPVEEPGPQENPNAVIPPGENLSEWATSSWLQAGVGYSFSP